MAEKKEWYKLIKVVGFASFIPLVMISGPLGGYFLGDFLQRRFSWGKHATLVCTLLGLASAIVETIRIIRAMIQVEKQQ